MVKDTRLTALLLPLATQSAATFLYVASYGGNVTTLDLSSSVGNTSVVSLEAIATTDACALSPSWLTLDSSKSVLYCTNEGLSDQSSLTSFTTNDDGSLEELDRIDVIYGAAHAAIYGKEGGGLAIAQYLGSSFSTLSAADPSDLAPLQNATYELSGPGTIPARQDAPHPHETIPDPTGEYLLVPDLGADLVRFYRVDATGLDWTEIEPLATTPGTGPRHGTFLVTDDKTYFYLVSELACTVTVYDVVYNSDSTLSLTELSVVPTLSDGRNYFNGSTAAEITLSPDENFLVVSTRGDNSFTIPNFDPSNSTEIVSDTITTYSVDHATGQLNPVQYYPAGGSFPRHFSLNGAGDLVAVGLQYDSRVVLIERNVEDGSLGEYVADATVEGQITAVIFNEALGS